MNRLAKWQKITGILVIVLVGSTIAYGPLIYDPVPQIPAAVQAELVSYMESNWQSPTEYVTGKFDDHNVVFLGEHHRVRHEVEFVQDLIPVLHEAGVFNLGIEFGSADSQDVVDSLLVADSYSDVAVRKLMFDHKVHLGYKEYLGLYRAAWGLNNSLGAEEKKFRIIHLDYSPDFSFVQKNMTDELRGKVWYKGEPDRHMAGVVEREVVAKGEKALVYCGRNHSFTKYHQPVFDHSLKQVKWKINNRLGNLVYEKIGEAACTVLLHSPWYGVDSRKAYYPVGGTIDRVMLELGNRSAGFDTHETPFGALDGDQSIYCQGYPDFNLATICDGYVFLKPIVEFEGCTLDLEFITDENFDEAMRRFPTLIGRKLIRTPWLLEQAMKWDANMKHYFRNLTG